MNKTQYKIDLHTHSIISHDGGISALEYEKALASEQLDCIAITDHNETSFARIMQKKLGDKIIIGEEITTTDGEIIGLYLKDTVPAGLGILETMKNIKLQGGLVYIPHPFETLRKGVQKSVLETIHQEIDIIEVYNGRGIFRGKPDEAHTFANNYTLLQAASSDAHCQRGLGYTWSAVSEYPVQSSLKRMFKEANLNKRHAPLYTFLCPFINKLKNKLILTNV